MDDCDVKGSNPGQYTSQPTKPLTFSGKMINCGDGEGEEISATTMKPTYRKVESVKRFIHLRNLSVKELPLCLH